MKRFLLKSLYAYASIRHPQIRKDYRYLIRDNYFSRLNQVRFLAKDYLFRKPYKVIDFQGEFDQEIRYVIPFAYWHYLNGTLLKTISSKNTRHFYFFSQNHEEKYQERIWEKAYGRYDVPNMTHSINFNYRKWRRVPYKEHYSNNIFCFEKPTLVIANKYNVEWGHPPINFLSIDVLDGIIKKFGPKYQIVYNRPLPAQITSDNSEILDLNEHQWLRSEHPSVILMDDLYKNYRSRVDNFNHLQLMVYANCSRFISMHGGTAALASCFGGKNIIFSKQGIEHELNEFSTIFPALSGAKIFHAKAEEQIFQFLEEHF